MTPSRDLEIVSQEARQRRDAGFNAMDAAYDIERSERDEWRDPERIVVDVNTLCRAFAGQRRPASIVPLFAQMTRNAASRRAR